MKKLVPGTFEYRFSRDSGDNCDLFVWFLLFFQKICFVVLYEC
ncbi:MAG: hypothetical protein WBC88_05145 [Candidatus Zixiibacteriota bacterium]